jgi:hypothetical protein
MNPTGKTVVGVTTKFNNVDDRIDIDGFGGNH